MGKAITWIIVAAAILLLIIAIAKSGVLGFLPHTNTGAKTSMEMLKTMAGK